MSSFVREKGLSKVIVASCNPKVVEWLRPDWSYDTHSQLMQCYTEDDSRWPPRYPVLPS